VRKRLFNLLVAKAKAGDFRRRPTALLDARQMTHKLLKFQQLKASLD
jgi:hypothetical protein